MVFFVKTINHVWRWGSIFSTPPLAFLIGLMIITCRAWNTSCFTAISTGHTKCTVETFVTNRFFRVTWKTLETCMHKSWFVSNFIVVKSHMEWRRRSTYSWRNRKKNNIVTFHWKTFHIYAGCGGGSLPKRFRTRGFHSTLVRSVLMPFRILTFKVSY